MNTGSTPNPIAPRTVIRHHAIVITASQPDMLFACYAEAQGLGCQISNIVASCDGHYMSFLVAPDGSSERDEQSHEEDTHRDRLIRWMDQRRYSDGSCPFDWVEVQYGDDHRQTRVVRHSDEEHYFPDRRIAQHSQEEEDDYQEQQRQA